MCTCGDFGCSADRLSARTASNASSTTNYEHICRERDLAGFDDRLLEEDVADALEHALHEAICIITAI